MIQLSNEEYEYIRNRDSRTFYSRLLIDCNEPRGIVRTMVINKGCCGSSLVPASIFSNYSDITVDYLKDTISGKKIELQIGFELNNLMRYFTVMTGYVSKPYTKGQKTTVSVLGPISAKLGKKFVGSGYTKVSELISRLEEVAGCSITLDEGLEDLDLPTEYDLSGYLYKEVLGLIAGLYFGYATETIDGNIVIKSFNTEVGVATSSLDRMSVYPSLYEKSKVEGIHVIAANDTEYTIGDLQNCDVTNPLMTEAAFNTYYTNFMSIEYEPHETELTLGDFTIEPWDVVRFEDEKGITHTVKPMTIRHVFDGGLKTTISAPEIDGGEDYYRGETARNASMAYNSLVSGKIGKGSGSISSSGVELFNISGDNITGGIGWIDSGGGQAFACINFTIPAVFNEAYASTTFSGNINFSASRSLKPYGYSSSFGVNLTIPVFWYNGEAHYSAGGLIVEGSIYPESKTYSIKVNFTNDYLFTECGEISVYNSETNMYDSLVGANFQVNASWLLAGID